MEQCFNEIIAYARDHPADFIGVLKDVAQIVAVIIGGLWIFYLYRVQRQNDAAVEINLDYKCFPKKNEDGKKDLHLTHFDVTLGNIGKVRVQGRKKRNDAYPKREAQDKEEKLKYGCSLLLRKVPENLSEQMVLDWFNQKPEKPLPESLKALYETPLVEADLLFDYAIKKSDQVEITDFWMEPGEIYHLGVGVVLSDGTYIAIVTFLGEKSDSDLWRRKFFLQIPKHKP